MSLRTWFVLAAAMMALVFAAPVMAAPSAQTEVDEVVVNSTSTFTLTVMIDEVTTVAIPVQVDWQAQGPYLGNEEEVLVISVPTVLRTGFFSVTVGTVEPSIGTMAITLTQESGILLPNTPTASDDITDTTPVTGTTPVSPTTPVVEPPAGTVPTANAIANLRSGPSTDFPIVGSADTGTALDIIGQNADGTWLALSNGAWIATFLVDNPPANLPVIETPAPPVAPIAPTTDITSTVVPTVTPTP
jgi:hypothetical protein